MADAFVQILLDNLSSLIQDEIGTIMGVDDEMKRLSSTLTTIQAVLEDAEMKQVESKAIRNWLRKLNDLAHEIDDILDECSTEVQKLQHKGSKSSRYNLKNILYQRKIGRRMKKVAKKLDDVAKERLNFHLDAIVVEKQNIVSFKRETCSIPNEPDHVYGRDMEKEKIVDILVNQVKDCQQLSVLPIIGIGGLGKTTLAQLVYKDPRVVEHFDIKLWVCVSDTFDISTLIKAMIESATSNGSATDLVRLDTLQQRLQSLLDQKKYLIVLDDVWNHDQEKWSALKSILACGSSGASIMITTRLKKVAEIMLTFPAHYLAGLSNESCWKLFRQRALGQDEELATNLEAIGKQIVERCAGVPLAAKTLGSLLRFKRDESEWVYVKESKLWNLPQEETSILPALKLSYHHLPLLLRRCFAYCAVFPKDTRIEKEELIHQWMAHGYISSNENFEVEDVGNEIWKELVLRSLFQDVQTFTGRTTFTLHDLVHDLAQSIMDNKVPGTQTESSTKSPSDSKIREVNLKRRFMAFPTVLLPNMDLPTIINKFSRLRSLNASRTREEDLPSSIGNLKHLRILNLSRTNIRTLPETICSLWNLEILNLDHCFRLVRLPKHMRDMCNLHHVYLENCDSLSEMPSRIGQLTFLKTLSMFIVGHKRGNRLEELESLNLGGRLEIKHLERVDSHLDAKKVNIAEKKNLRSLRLEWEVGIPSRLGETEDEKMLEALEPHPSVEALTIRGFKGRNFPPWMGNDATLVNIVEIEIADCPNCLRLPQVLRELPRLEVLRLSNLNLEYVMEDGVAGVDSVKEKFPRLRRVGLINLPNLKGLLKEQTREYNMFPNIYGLDIEHCPSLLMLPELLSLRILTLHTTTERLILTPVPNLETLYFGVMDDDNGRTPVGVEGLKNLTKLKTLTIWGAHEQFFPEEEMGVLTFVTSLWLGRSKTKMGLPEGWLQHLTALRSLTIRRCSKFIELPQGIGQHLHNLISIRLFDLPEMTRLPEALRLLPSLEYLFLIRLPQLALLPDWLGMFTHLRELYIHDCPNIASLPDVLQNMRSIQNIVIKSCPELERRCEKGKGEDWHKIKHIPVIDFRDESDFY